MKKLFGVIVMMTIISMSLFAQSNITISKEVRDLPVCLYEDGADAGIETIESYFLDKEFADFENTDGSINSYSYGDCTSDDTSCFIEIINRNFVTEEEQIILFNFCVYDDYAWLENISIWVNDRMVGLARYPSDKIMMIFSFCAIVKN